MIAPNARTRKSSSRSQIAAARAPTQIDGAVRLLPDPRGGRDQQQDRRPDHWPKPAQSVRDVCHRPNEGHQQEPEVAEQGGSLEGARGPAVDRLEDWDLQRIVKVREGVDGVMEKARPERIVFGQYLSLASPDRPAVTGDHRLHERIQ